MGGFGYPGKTLIVDTSNGRDDFKMSVGAVMNEHQRYDYGCGTFMLKDNYTKVIVVAGGHYLKTTELWYSNTNEWQLGPNLPNECLNPSVITSPDGNSVIIIGCQENTKGEIYVLREDEFGTLSWNTMKQKLKFPRTQTIGLLLPDNLCECS